VVIVMGLVGLDGSGACSEAAEMGKFQRCLGCRESGEERGDGGSGEIGDTLVMVK
jgi:hypothetical protein